MHVPKVLGWRIWGLKFRMLLRALWGSTGVRIWG